MSAKENIWPQEIVTENRIYCTIRKFKIFCSSINIIMTMKTRNMRWLGHVARAGDANAYFIFKKREGKVQFGKPRSR
jgi:hypothetical protein